jgi:hypothetical protein
MNGKVIDLDVLRPKPQVVKLAGKEIDVSFIPCGITFDVDRLTNELAKYTVSQLEAGGKEAKKAFDLSVELCSVFCTVKYPEMTEEWFRANVDPLQVQAFAEILQSTLARSYEGAERYSKNLEAAEVTVK